MLLLLRHIDVFALSMFKNDLTTEDLVKLVWTNIVNAIQQTRVSQKMYKSRCPVSANDLQSVRKSFAFLSILSDHTAEMNLTAETSQFAKQSLSFNLFCNWLPMYQENSLSEYVTLMWIIRKYYVFSSSIIFPCPDVPKNSSIVYSIVLLWCQILGICY